MARPVLRSGPLLDRAQRRVLGAVRLVDAATGRPLARPLSVAGAGMRFLRNRSDLYVISAAPGLESHPDAFETPPDAPAADSLAFELLIDDPLGAYLPRRAGISLPRRATRAEGEDTAPLHRPIDIEVYPSPAAPLRITWSGLRLSLRSDGDAPRPLPGVLATLRAPHQPVQIFGRGLSDERGEALVLAIGLPAHLTAGGNGNGGGDVTARTTEAALDLLFDRDLPWPADPEAIPAARRVARANMLTVALGMGAIVHHALTIALEDDDDGG